MAAEKEPAGERRRCGRAPSRRASNAWGRAAEDQAARWYEDRGGEVVARRWRAREGELDLVVALDDLWIFVEVKARRTLDSALRAVSAAAWRRRERAALAFLAEMGVDAAEMRFDLAAVGRDNGFAVVENATV